MNNMYNGRFCSVLLLIIYFWYKNMIYYRCVLYEATLVLSSFPLTVLLSLFCIALAIILYVKYTHTIYIFHFIYLTYFFLLILCSSICISFFLLRHHILVTFQLFNHFQFIKQFQLLKPRCFSTSEWYRQCPTLSEIHLLLIHISFLGSYSLCCTHSPLFPLCSFQFQILPKHT